MIHITRSHNLKILSEALAGKLTQMAPDDPLKSRKIIIPNLDTARWFKLQAARKNGIAANLECMLPAEWLWKQIRKIYSDLPQLLPSDLQPMKWMLYRLLIEPENLEKFPILDRYVTNQPEERREEAVFQLAGQIAAVFDEYLVYRPDMMLRWQNGQSGKDDERWQADLWRLLNDFWKKSNRDNKTEKNRAELYNEVFTALSNREIETDECLYIFNPGLLPRPILKLVKEAGRQSDIFIYQIELSRETEQNRNELLQVFGQEQTSIQQLFNNLEPGEINENHPEIKDDLPLSKIQKGILEGKAVTEIHLETGLLNGIEIRSCHSPLREIEVLHQFLLERFEENEDLHPDDILVVTPDPEAYRPYIKAVFDQAEDHLPAIPYHAGYSKGGSEFGVERALLHLLSVIDSRFEFSSVMVLFMMKPVCQSFGISEPDTAKVRRWIEENHVVWGLDAGHRREFGQPGEELQTWNSALRRGWYGQLMGGEKGERLDDLLLFPAIQSTNDQKIWAAFSSYLNQLKVMKAGIKKKRSAKKWTDWILSHMDFLFDEASLASFEAQNILRVLNQIKEQSSAANCDEGIPYSLFKKELASMLDRHRASGALFTNGITFSSMVPVRSIPFKIIALIGLNDSTFPRKQISPDFDLIAQSPQEGERNRKNEDRNLFLESIMAAGQAHYCSYIGQSQVDNEEIPPSTIVSEWVDLLSSGTGLDESRIIRKEALTGFSPSNFETPKSYSRIYYQTAQQLSDDENAISGLKLDRPIPLEDQNESIQINDLIRFYNNPIRWFLRNRFDVSLREMEREKDEFSLDHLERHILFQRVFGWMLNGLDEDEIHSYLVQSGTVPAGWPGEKQVLDLKQNVGYAISAMNKIGIKPKQVPFDLSLRLSNVDVEGTLISYSEDQFVDVNPSEFSGKIAISSWIKHLCSLSAGRFEEKSSILFSKLKKGDPDRRIFLPVQHAEELLSEMIDFYRDGLIEPQTFFPKTLYVFEERERDEKRSGSYNEAAKAFNTGDFSFGESNDMAIKTMLGEDVEFQNRFITDRYRQIIGRVFDHMEEMK